MQFQFHRTWIAPAAIALYGALPVAAQTTATMEAESMSLSGYAVDNGSRIKLTASRGSGSASKRFTGKDGTYNMQVHVLPENDGRSTLEVWQGATRLRTYTYPLGTSATSFTISGVALKNNDTIKLVGRPNEGALARVDKVVLTQVSTSTSTTTPVTTTPVTTTPVTTTPVTTTPVTTTPVTTTPVTTTPVTTTPSPTTPTTTTPIIGNAVASVTMSMEAEAMALSSYAVENGNRIKLTSSTGSGSASKSFTGADGTYNMLVHVVPENDGQSTLEVWKGATRLRTYTYPLSTSATSFTISNVALKRNDTIKLVGRPNRGAMARVDKVVLTRVTSVTNPVPTSPTEPAPTDPAPTSPPVLTLPSTNTKAIATFESLGLYWKPPANPGAAGCTVQYRKSGESAWKQGLAMWYDARNGECRGSLVYLSPGTQYQVQLSMPGQQPSAQLAAKTWSENFPIAKVVSVASGSQTLNITQGGTASGYVLYTSPPGGQSTIDAANARENNITISAPYVIVRGLVLKGAQRDAIRLLSGAHDVVIEGNDISGWGRYSKTLSNGQQAGVNLDSGIHASNVTGLERVIIQRNRIHHPRYGANSWAFGHPSGPQAVTFSESGSNHVIRHNEVYSSEGRYFNDAFGGCCNAYPTGFPNADSDIYGNMISHVWDDAIEAEGGNRNVRIFGNYADRAMIAVATTVTQVGPVYIFRNVHNRSRNSSEVSTDNDSGGPFGKSGDRNPMGHGRRYVFHNTTLQAKASGATLPLGAANGLSGPNDGISNTMSRNNIWHLKKSGSSAIYGATSTTNSFDRDLFNGKISAYAGAQPNGINGTPIYAAGHGWSSESNGLYQLAPNSPGYDRGARLPNFNDHYTGSAPDMGAAEAGRPAMRFGLRAATSASTSSDGAANR